jgi:predicted MFS family arabinose efflux permease
LEATFRGNPGSPDLFDTRSPDDLMLAFRGGMPLGNLLAGYVAQRWSITAALAVNGTVLTSVAMFLIARRTRLDE